MIAVFCIGKTGGTTLSNYLHRTYGTQCLRELQHLKFSILGHIHRDELEIYLRQMPKERFASVSLIVGHIPIGLNETLPSINFDYVTLMREPSRDWFQRFFISTGQRFQISANTG